MLRAGLVVALCLGWLDSGAAAEHKQVLLLFSNESLLPAGNALGQSLQATLEADAPAPLDFYTEFLDAVRFPGPEHDARRAAFLADKYAGLRFDLVFAIGPQALDFLARHRAMLVRDAPLVFAGIRDETLKRQGLPPNATGIVSQFDLVKTLELARRLQPAAGNLAVVTGASPFDRAWEAAARREFQSYESRLTITYLSALPLGELLQRLAQLPTETIVIYLSLFEDGRGSRFIPRDAVAAISSAASAPVYGVYDTYVGHGIVGGYMDSFEAVGRAAAKLGGRVLAGERPESIPPSEAETHRFLVDWRQLRRWRLSETNLPAGTTIRFKEPSLWNQYRAEVVVVAGLLLLQSLLILALLLQARRRRRAESALKESETWMSLATSSANLGLWRLDIATGRLWATEHCRRMLGLDPHADLTPHSFANAIHSGDRERATQICVDAMVQGKSYEQEYRVALPDGRVRWILDRAHSIRDGADRLQRMTGVVIDITERKRAEEELREGEERYRNVVETQTELICRYLPDTTLTFVNDAYCRYFGRRREALVGTRFLELIPEPARSATLQHVQSLIENPRSESLEHQVLRPDGSIGWQQWIDHVITDANGTAVELQGIGRDVTELKQAEREARERREEVTHLTRVGILGELSGALAHELNQPLAAILANAQAAQLMLAREPADLAEVREILDDIMEDDNRAGEVIRRLRALMRRGETRFQRLDMNEIAAEVLNLTRSELIMHKVTVEQRLSPGLPPVLGDRVQLEQVLLNLVVNACESIDGNGSAHRALRLSTVPAADRSIEISIADTGRGIPAEVADRLFEPFFTTKEHGLGLGLSISRSIIAAHGGRLRAVNNPDRGATFFVTLPPDGSIDGDIA